MKTMEEIFQMAKRDFQNRLRIENPASVESIAHEIARNCIPSSSKEILLLAARNLDLALEEPPQGPAFDGTNKAINFIAGNIRDAVYKFLLNPQAYHQEADRQFENVYQTLLLQLNADQRDHFYTKNLYEGQSRAKRK